MCGCPQSIHSDQGSSFQSLSFKQWLSYMGICKSQTTIYRSQGSGQCEILNGALGKGSLLALHTINMPITKWKSDNRDNLDSLKQPETTNNDEKEESTQSKEDSTLTINETCGDQTGTHVENVEIPNTTYLRRSKRTIRKPIRYRE
ncbi:hypothetical protein GJ496_011817 [Pomphorhynchus laevis]|nr:hypothetical protein GJ496_011817 [Pomphorhynchus laevis]